MNDNHDFESIGKQAVKDGYDGGGIWHCSGIIQYYEGKSWKRQEKTDDLFEWHWPDFSHSETEGAALAWIAEKKNLDMALLIMVGDSYRVTFQSNGIQVVSDQCHIMSTRAGALLSAIQSIGLGKKDNSPMGLNKRLLALGFRFSHCKWIRFPHAPTINEAFPIEESVIEKGIELGFVPDGSHPSTIGVATAWIESIVGPCFYLYVSRIHEEVRYYVNFDEFKQPDRGYKSKLEALVEFAEWARENGLMK